MTEPKLEIYETTEDGGGPETCNSGLSFLVGLALAGIAGAVVVSKIGEKHREEKEADASADDLGWLLRRGFTADAGLTDPAARRVARQQRENDEARAVATLSKYGVDAKLKWSGPRIIAEAAKLSALLSKPQAPAAQVRIPPTRPEGPVCQLHMMPRPGETPNERVQREARQARIDALVAAGKPLHVQEALAAQWAREDAAKPARPGNDFASLEAFWKGKRK